jgi:hypothetical protein
VDRYLTVSCPRCLAEPGQPCVYLPSALRRRPDERARYEKKHPPGQPMRRPHRERFRAWHMQ